MKVKFQRFPHGFIANFDVVDILVQLYIHSILLSICRGHSSLSPICRYRDVARMATSTVTQAHTYSNDQ